MSTIEELKEVVKETLENRGVLGQIRARVRAEIFLALDGNANGQAAERPPLSNENLLINELIREYLEFNAYRHTSSVLTQESGQPRTPLDRQFLAHELNVREESSSSNTDMPLLYSIIHYFLNRNRSGGGVATAASGGGSQSKTDARTPRSARTPRGLPSQLSRQEDEGGEVGPFVIKGTGGSVAKNGGSGGYFH